LKFHLVFLFFPCVPESFGCIGGGFRHETSSRDADFGKAFVTSCGLPLQSVAHRKADVRFVLKFKQVKIYANGISQRLFSISNLR